MSKRRGRVTLRDVAQAAGVSLWTASNTFSNPDRVAEATRQRVLAAADALDYAGPNPGARALALGSTNMIALVAPQDASDLLSDPGAALVAEGLLSSCDRAGLSLVFAGHGDSPGVDGRVFLRTSPEETDRGPAVVVDRDVEDVPCVRAETGPAAAQLAQHLIDLGHRRIAVITGPEDQERLDGAAGVLDALGPVTAFRTTGAAWPTEPHGEGAARRALNATPRPTALMALTDPLALGALDAAYRMGLRVPQDISITGLDGVPGAEAQGLTSALVPYRPMGELAGSVLVARIAGDPLPPLPPLPVQPTIRATTGPAATS